MPKKVKAPTSAGLTLEDANKAKSPSSTSASAASAPSLNHATLQIWPDGVPGILAHSKSEEEGLRDDIGHWSMVHVPTLTFFPPVVPSTQKSAVIIFPGGGYSQVTYEKEGTSVASWLNKLGIAVFVLKYRHKPYTYPAPLQDGLQAIRYVRAHADEYDIFHEHIGVLGFSAGGHLGAMCGTLYDHPDGKVKSKAGSALDNISARPDFMILIYPIITMDLRYTHLGSRENLIGNMPNEDLISQASANLQVTSNTPPAFILHTGDDESVSVENSILMYRAMQRHDLAVELHIWADGPHGLGVKVNNSYPVTLEWPHLLEKWMSHMNVM
jgi:acetyl esterase/lipase